MERKVKHTVITAYLYILMTLYAVSITMIGPVMPRLISEYAIRTSQGGLIITVSSLGGILSIIIVGLLADHLSKPKLIWFSYIFFGLSFFLVAYVRIYSALLFLFFIFGASSRITDTVINAYISDLHKERRSVYLNLLHTFFGVGAFAGPIYIRFLIDRDFSWQKAFSYLGILCLVVIAIMYFILPKQRKDPQTDPAQQTNPLKHMTALRGSPVMLTVCLIMFFYLGHQVGVVTWIPMYMLEELQAGPALASWALSLFWVGIILGRFVCSCLAKKVSVPLIIGFGSIGGFVIFGGGLLWRDHILLIISLAVTGLLTGATIPLLVTMACDYHPRHSGAVSSLIFFSGSLAAMLFPWLIGLIAESAGFQTAMLLSWAVIGLCAAGGFYLCKSVNGQRS